MYATLPLSRGVHTQRRSLCIWLTSQDTTAGKPDGIFMKKTHGVGYEEEERKKMKKKGKRTRTADIHYRLWPKGTGAEADRDASNV